MKQTCNILFMLLILSSTIQAQPSTMIYKQINQLNKLHNSPNKTRTTVHRILSDSSYEYNTSTMSLLPQKKTEYTWSGNRGGVLDWNFGWPQAPDNEMFHPDLSDGTDLKIFKQFNQLEQLSNVLNIQYSPSTSTWDTTYQVSYTYLNGYVDKAYYTGYSNNAVSYRMRAIMIYDANNNLTTVYFEDGGINGTTWVNNGKEEYLYSGTNLTQLNSFMWNTSINGWENLDMYVYTYNANNLEKIVHRNWNTTSWLNDYKEEYTFNASNQELSTTYFDWVNNAWEAQDGTIKVYNASGQLDSLHEYFIVPMVYTGSWKFNYANTTAEKCNEKTWYPPSGSLSEPYRYQFTFDANNNPLTIDIKYFNSTVNNWYYMNGNTSFRSLRYEEYNYWPTGIQNTNESFNAMVFPNPSSSSCYISFTTPSPIETNIEVVDMLGNILFNAKEEKYIGDHLVKISTTNMAKGIYTLRIKTPNQGQQSLKFIKN